MIDLTGLSNSEVSIRLLALRAANPGRVVQVRTDLGMRELVGGLLKAEGIPCELADREAWLEVTIGSLLEGASAVPTVPAMPVVTDAEFAAMSTVEPAAQLQRPCGMSPARAVSSGATVVFVASESVGEGDSKLGEVLMKSAIRTFRDMVPAPSAIILMNSGVYLSCRNGQVADDLNQMCRGGVDVLSCGTCLDFYKLRDHLVAGRVSNMAEILSVMGSAARVIRL